MNRGILSSGDILGGFYPRGIFRGDFIRLAGFFGGDFISLAGFYGGDFIRGGVYPPGNLFLGGFFPRPRPLLITGKIQNKFFFLYYKV